MAPPFTPPFTRTHPTPPAPRFELSHTPVHFPPKALGTKGQELALLAVVKWLTHYGVPLNSLNRDGRSPIHYGCRKGRLEIVKWLQAQGLEITIADKFGLNCKWCCL